MGTYDTRGGSPASPDIEDPYIFAEEDLVLEILEQNDIQPEICDQVVKLVRELCEAKSELKAERDEALADKHSLECANADMRLIPVEDMYEWKRRAKIAEAELDALSAKIAEYKEAVKQKESDLRRAVD